MKASERVLPVILSALLLVGSVAMSVPLAAAAYALLIGHAVPSMAWLYPLTILATGALLTSLLSRMQVPLRLYALAVMLWMVTASCLVIRAL
ncbi:MAG TPA: hypothetical protein VMU84_06250 [Thermoanaerobaculia bacterium]|nr:hypothetical protein [Thermoanaerobaculia bacterium]